MGCSKGYHKIHYGTISDEALPIGTAKTTSSHIPAHVQFLHSYVTHMCSSEVRSCYGSVSLYLCRTVIPPSSNVEVQRCAQVSIPWVYIKQPFHRTSSSISFFSVSSGTAKLFSARKEEIRVRWEGNNSLMYDGKTQDIALKYVVEEDRANIAVGKLVKVKWGRSSQFGKWLLSTPSLRVRVSPRRQEG